MVNSPACGFQENQVVHRFVTYIFCLSRICNFEGYKAIFSFHYKGWPINQSDSEFLFISHAITASHKTASWFIVDVIVVICHYGNGTISLPGNVKKTCLLSVREIKQILV